MNALSSTAGSEPVLHRYRPGTTNLRSSASCPAISTAISTYCEAIRVCALQRRDSGRLHLRFVFCGSAAD
ncbi:MAG: hypothetical protein O8C65_12190 [Candidatus Methanoperedens sp.]|nr:hypothetical protein [Candidatus Methanoperedens sp.]